MPAMVRITLQRHDPPLPNEGTLAPAELADGTLGWEVCAMGWCRRGPSLPVVIQELEGFLGYRDSSSHQPVPGVNR